MCIVQPELRSAAYVAIKLRRINVLFATEIPYSCPTFELRNLAAWVAQSRNMDLAETQHFSNFLKLCFDYQEVPVILSNTYIERYLLEKSWLPQNERLKRTSSQF